jgi:hypothetical protein
LRKLLVLGLLAVWGVAAERVGVPGSSTRYTTPVAANVAGRQVTLVLTGTAVRQKYYFNVYSVGSYLQEGVKVGSAEELAGIDCPKRLHLIMERNVDGKDLAEAFRAAIRMNHPEPAFRDEVQRLFEALCQDSAHQGDHVLLTHEPGVGLRCSVAGRADILIKNPRFSRAVWDIYLGRKNLGEGIKRGLVSRL